MTWITVQNNVLSDKMFILFFTDWNTKGGSILSVFGSWRNTDSKFLRAVYVHTSYINSFLSTEMGTSYIILIVSEKGVDVNLVLFV